MLVDAPLNFCAHAASVPYKGEKKISQSDWLLASPRLAGAQLHSQTLFICIVVMLFGANPDLSI